MFFFLFPKYEKNIFAAVILDTYKPVKIKLSINYVRKLPQYSKKKWLKNRDIFCQPAINIMRGKNPL